MFFGPYDWPLTRLYLILLVLSIVTTWFSTRVLHVGLAGTAGLIVVVYIAAFAVQIALDRPK